MELDLDCFKQDTTDLFRLNFTKDIIKYKNQLSNTLAILNGKLTIPDHYRDLLDYPPETIILHRWEGQYSSDMFAFPLQAWLDYSQPK